MISRRSFAVLAVAPLLAGVGACSSVGTTTAPAKPLAFRPVLGETQGACPTGKDGYLADNSDGSCLHLGAPSLTVHRLKDAQAVKTDQGVWTVDLTLNDADAARFGRLTSELSQHTEPSNRVALVVGSGPSARVLSAPEVMSSIDTGTLRITGHFTKSSARQLVRDLGG